MDRGCSLEQAEKYEDDGIVFPLTVLSPDEVVRYRTALEAVSVHLGGRLKRMDQCHLFFRWAYDLCTHPRVLDAVEALVGPDVIVHSTRVFYKHPRDEAYVSWHQDGRSSDLNRFPGWTAWIALSDSTVENGCLRVIPGSHKSLHPHDLGEDKDNLVNHGQRVAIEIDESLATDVVLAAGQMSLHHVNLIHGSEPNRSDTKRIGFSVSYITPRVERAALPVIRARGRDDYHHFDFLAEPPSYGLDDGLAAHTAFIDQRRWPRTRIG